MLLMIKTVVGALGLEGFGEGTRSTAGTLRNIKLRAPELWSCGASSKSGQLVEQLVSD